MRLTDCFIDLIAYIAYFLKTVKKRQPSFERVRTDIDERIRECRGVFEKGSFSEEDYALARFAVFAWIDEAILNSSWREKNRWQGETLQRRYDQTSNAGEQFFERLNTLGLHQRDAREVYYLCLAMGFTGRYCHEGDDYLLDQLKTSNLKILTGSSAAIPSIESGDLFPDAYSVEYNAPDDSLEERSLFFNTLLWLGAPALFCMAFFYIFNGWLNDLGADIIGRVN